MAKAIDVAKYILAYREARNHMTTAFALQKLLYYCQAWMLVAKDRPLFSEQVIAWEHGPVVTEVSPYCKGRYYVFPREIPEANVNNLTLSERSLIDRVLSIFDKEEDENLGDALEQMSHQEKPWASVAINQVISPESMLNFYSSVQADPSTSHSAPIPDLADISDCTFISTDDADFLESLLAE